MHDNTLKVIKITSAGAAGLIAAWFRSVWPLIVMVTLALVFDYLTGMLAAVREESLSSKKGWLGLLKKVAMLGLLALGFGLDLAIPYLVESGLSLTIPINLPFGLILAAWIVINEAISICENLYRCGAPVPQWLVKLLTVARKDLTEEE